MSSHDTPRSRQLIEELRKPHKAYTKVRPMRAFLNEVADCMEELLAQPSETVAKMPTPIADSAKNLSPEARAVYIQECYEAAAAYAKQAAPSATQPKYLAVGTLHAHQNFPLHVTLDTSVQLPAWYEHTIYVREIERE